MTCYRWNVPDTRTGADRRETRENLVEVAARLLREQGASAVTTRAVAQAAGVQAPAIYRLFGDKDGLLDAVAEHVLAAYVAGKALAAGQRRPDRRSPGGVAHADRLRPRQRRAVRASSPIPAGALARRPRPRAWRSCGDRVRRVAATGRLRVTERRAVDLFHAAGTGTVFTLLSMAPQDRDPGLADAMYDAVMQTILTDAPALPEEARPRPPSRSVPSCPTCRTSATPNARSYPSGWTGSPAPEPASRKKLCAPAGGPSLASIACSAARKHSCRGPSRRHLLRQRAVYHPRLLTAFPARVAQQAAYQRSRCTTSLNGRRMGFLIGASGRQPGSRAR